MTFLLSEDKALRDLLKGMTVTDQKADGGDGGKRNVGVWFGQPDQEIRSQSYPYLTIDMVDVGEDFSRAHRGKVKPDYYDDPTVMGNTESFDAEIHDWEMDWPVPVIIDYQVTSYARQPRHDREILAQLMSNKLPLRFGVLEPDDGTVRRMDIMGISKRDVTENGKRLFMNSFTVRVSSEIPRSLYRRLYKVLQVNIDGATGGNENLTPIESVQINIES
jgi:hypothetical protein